MNSLSNTLGIVLAGGVGQRLGALTTDRAKPAVPFGGQYRVIDFTLANCVNSGLRRVLVLTQYKSQSLLSHLQNAWNLSSPHCGDYITAVPPQMRTGDSWYSGTANAVYQNLDLVKRSGAKNVLILSGDHVYRMDYSLLLRQHELTGADVTVACMEVSLKEARSFGVLKLDKTLRVTEFEEKPATPNAIPGRPNHAFASMGIYVFSVEAICKALMNDNQNAESNHDFGSNILPGMISAGSVYGYQFGKDNNATGGAYWRDVGTIDSYYQASMDLLAYPVAVSLHDKTWPIRSCDPPGPPVLITRDCHGVCGAVSDSILGRGVVVAGGHVSKSILSSGTLIDSDAVVSDSILFDDVQVGEGAVLQRCVVDKGVRIPAGARVGFEQDFYETNLAVSENGVTVIPKVYQFRQRTSSQIHKHVDHKMTSEAQRNSAFFLQETSSGNAVVR